VVGEIALLGVYESGNFAASWYTVSMGLFGMGGKIIRWQPLELTLQGGWVPVGNFAEWKLGVWPCHRFYQRGSQPQQHRNISKGHWL